MDYWWYTRDVGNKVVRSLIKLKGLVGPKHISYVIVYNGYTNTVMPYIDITDKYWHEMLKPATKTDIILYGQ